MAVLTLETLRNQIRTQIWGRRLGLDTTPDQTTLTGSNAMRGGLLVGVAGMRLPIQVITTTGGSSIYPSGYIELASTTGSSAINSIQAPIPGAEFTIMYANTSTLGMQIQSSGANFATTTGSSANQMTFVGPVVSVRLVGVSTSLFRVLSIFPTSSNGGGSSANFFTSTF